MFVHIPFTQFYLTLPVPLRFPPLHILHVNSYHSLIALILPVIFTYFVIFSTFLLKTFKALNGLLCADVPLRNYSHSLIFIIGVSFFL